MTERPEQLINMFLQTPFAMTEEQSRELSDWISQDTKNTKEFIQASLFHRCIHDVLLSSDEERNYILQDNMEAPDTNMAPFDRQLWDMLLKEEETAPEIETERHLAPNKELIQHVSREKTVRKANKAALLTFIISAAALIFLIIYVKFVPSTVHVEVATLTDSLNAQWAESSALTSKGSRLMTNHTPLILRKGYAELVFDNHPKVVIEAPAEFQVLSYDQIKLTYGRLYATVPQEAMGFVVSTPNSKIIDLGTEFGVQANVNGTTELHVVKGRTTLVSGPEDNKTNIFLNAGSARKVTADSLEPIDIACSKKIFVRQIDSQSHFIWRGQNLSLADIVGGGNGFGTGQVSQGIEASTGKVIRSLSTTDVRSGAEGYIPVPSNSYIDGIFIPGLVSGMAQVTSIGLQTNEFPKTSGMAWGYIFNGAWHHSLDVPRHNLQLNGVTYDGKRNPAIAMHSNLGITFDLSIIRKKLPGVRIQSFSSTVGISETVNKWLKSRDFGDWDQSPEVLKLTKERQSTTEFWVFLDGKKVLRQKASSASKAGTIDIPIDESVRFLTLAVTEADDTCMFDWALFAQPELILELAGEQIGGQRRIN